MGRALVILVLLLGAGAAQATTTVYSGRAAFEAAHPTLAGEETDLVMDGPDEAGRLELLFESGVQAVGFDVMSLGGEQSVTVSVFSGDELLLSTVLLLSDAAVFFGISDELDITRVSLDSLDDLLYAVDHVVFGAPQITPEPGTALLCAAGLLVLGILSRR